MRIERLELTGIGPFEDAVFDFGPAPTSPGELVLFEGPNGSGKTTVIEAIAHMISGDNSLDSQIPDRHAKRSGSKDDAVNLVVRMDGELRQLTRPMRLEKLVRVPEGAPIREVRRAWAAFGYRAHEGSANLSTPGPREIAEPALKGSLAFRHASAASLGQLLMNLNYERIQARDEASEEKDVTKRDRLQALASRRKASVARFEEATSIVLDRNVSVVFPKGAVQPKVLFDGKEIPPEMLGEGMRNTLGWVSDLFVRLERVSWENDHVSPFDQEFWLLLDEVDESLHPQFQTRLFPALRKLFPNARVYATTHSPFVVASVGEGAVFRIQPGAADHCVRGEVERVPLEPGQSLDVVTQAIFGARAGIIDATRHELEMHERDVSAVRLKRDIDWVAFLERRTRLHTLNDEVRTAMALIELPARRDIEAHLAPPTGTHG